MGELTVDASALVDLLLGNELGQAVQHRIRGHALHAPAHLDAEVLSALGRLQRAERLPAAFVSDMLEQLGAAPIRRHSLPGLLLGAWARRHELRLVDALYVELAESQGVSLVTTDRRLRAIPIADVVVA